MLKQSILAESAFPKALFQLPTLPFFSLQFRTTAQLPEIRWEMSSVYWTMHHSRVHLVRYVQNVFQPPLVHLLGSQTPLVHLLGCTSTSSIGCSMFLFAPVPTTSLLLGATRKVVPFWERILTECARLHLLPPPLLLLLQMSDAHY